jgi:CRISPR-associated protein Cas6
MTMFWQDDEDTPEITIPDNVVDVLFALQCREIPVDHCHALSTALLDAAPWLDEPGCGIHSIHVAGSQNGWERPSHGVDQALLLSRRTKLSIRVPRERVEQLRAALEGKTFDVGGAALGVGSGKPKALSQAATLFARYVAGPAELDEEGFLRWAAEALTALDIRMRKALCGKATALATPAGPLITRSLMLANLSADESVRLQERGLGPHRVMGCGLFIPHKGIDAVQKPQ